MNFKKNSNKKNINKIKNIINDIHQIERDKEAINNFHLD